MSPSAIPDVNFHLLAGCKYFVTAEQPETLPKSCFTGYLSKKQTTADYTRCNRGGLMLKLKLQGIFDLTVWCDVVMGPTGSDPHILNIIKNKEIELSNSRLQPSP